jgi:hypothetical protein
MNDLYKNPIAEVDNPDSGWIINPAEARPLKEAGHKFFCPDFDCGDPQRGLFIKKSGKGNDFFSHYPGFDHDIGPETLLHKLAVRWFIGKTSFEIPPGKAIDQQVLSLDPEKTIPEYSRLKTMIPDVKLTTIDGFEFALEIFVTNDISWEKKKVIEQFGLPTLRIDLSGFYEKHPEQCRTDKDFVETSLDRLLSDLSLKEWVGAAKTEPEPIPESIKEPQATPPGCMMILPVVVFLLFINWLFND